MRARMARALSTWPSLGCQFRLAEALHGAAGPGRVAAWLARQEARIGDAGFARRFADHLDLPGIAPLDYAHRRVATRRLSLVGGIRFFGRDTRRPFVEIIAHDAQDMGALAEAVAAEWRAFAPGHMRLRRAPGEPLPAGARLDTSLYAARHRELAPATGRVRLARFDDPEAAMALVAGRYARMARQVPALRRNLAPLDPGAARDLWRTGHLHAIAVEGAGIVGLIAARPGRIGWLCGDEMREEVVAADHAGHGHAAAAQSALAALGTSRPARYLIGTIDGLNAASRRSAERAGRRRMLDDVFVPLPRPEAIGGFRRRGEDARNGRAPAAVDRRTLNGETR